MLFRFQRPLDGRGPRPTRSRRFESWSFYNQLAVARGSSEDFHGRVCPRAREWTFLQSNLQLWEHLHRARPMAEMTQKVEEPEWSLLFLPPFQFLADFVPLRRWAGAMWRMWTTPRASMQCAASSGLVKFFCIRDCVNSSRFFRRGWILRRFKFSSFTSVLNRELRLALLGFCRCIACTRISTSALDVMAEPHLSETHKDFQTCWI